LKKLIGMVAGVILVAAIAVVFIFVANNPEKKIIGKWTDANTNISLEFMEDGTVKFPIEFFNQAFEADISGKYLIDKQNDKITFTFSFFSIDYSKLYSFEIKGDSLTLTNDSSGKSNVLTKQKTN
jgi:hypothetical protein